ncbi:MAG: Crp/Fnr family transcriptional regulator [Pseudomonadota bacterium]|nr:Crp/Fnr family transcriptional regulator [Pseudomonadota bacterium]|tara:strand:- start:4301 stop:5002 length:702 start_codon:yes stop_codon:yes gene_type:complete
MLVTPELLGTFPSLKPLPLPLLQQLAQQSTVQRFARRGVVLKAGVREESVCFLFEGRLQGVDFTIDGREVGLYFVEPGDFCGELGMFDDGPQPEHVIALTSAMVVFVPLASLRQVTREHAVLLQRMGERLAARVRQMTRQRSLLGLPNVGQRVCCQLWMLIPESGRSEGNQTIIRNPPTHMEIAIMLSLSRESVSRVFQLLQAREIVKRDGPGALIVHDLLTLQRLAEGAEEL